MASSVFLLPGSVNGVVPATSGGTGITSYAVGDLLYADTTTTLAKLADVATGSVLVSGGLNTAPAYSANPTLTSLTLGTSGILSGGTNVVEERNGVNAMGARVYNTTDAGTANYERLDIQWSGNTARIFTSSAGTGVARSLDLGAGGSQQWRIVAGTGNLIALTDNSFDFGASGATRAKTGYFGTSVVTPLANIAGFLSGARSTNSGLQSVTGAVTLSGATTATTNIIPAGATVESIATSTTTTITGATGYQVGDGSDADRYGDITGTAVGTASGSTNYTADPRWWTNAARAVTLTAKTSNFTGGVVQVTVFYINATGA